MAENHEHYDTHGHTLAAWVLVGILLVAAAMLSLSVAIQSTGLVIAGIVVAIVGLIAGKVLKVAGHGKQTVSESAQG